MTITVDVLRKSRAGNHTIATIKARYPRFIHAEVMTHRVFSRNASSSRAIPVMKMLRDIWRDMAFPNHWGANRPGMQATEELGRWRRQFVYLLWIMSGTFMLGVAWLADKLGAHKQVVNRLVEPWMHITVIVTSTQWENFFGLRCHPDAEPNIRELAEKIQMALEASYTFPLEQGEWHLPMYSVTDESNNDGVAQHSTWDKIKICVARCASVSYLTVDGKIMSVDRATLLHDKLVASDPIHASALEHAAMADQNNEYPQHHRNFQGFAQYRGFVENP